MGLAATQARFLQCTARQTNLEYQGQQINNARAILANKSANANSQMLTLKVPTPPNQADFTTVNYALVVDGKKLYFTKKEYEDLYTTIKTLEGGTALTGNAVDTSTVASGTYKYSNGAGGTVPDAQKLEIKGKKYNIALRTVAGSDEGTYPASLNTNTKSINSIWISETEVFTPPTALENIGRDYNGGASSFSVEEVTNQAGYEDAYNQYRYEQYLYEQEIQNINAKTSMILQQDKVLELQLKQIDTERTEVKTELEALNKVLGEHVESEFKTFAN